MDQRRKSSEIDKLAPKTDRSTLAIQITIANREIDED